MIGGTQRVDVGVEMSNSAAASLEYIISSIGDVSSRLQSIAVTA